MKLIITICAYNEAKTIDEVLQSIPRTLEGIDVVEVVVVDDGSSDNTAIVARTAGADVVVVHKKNMGLATSYKHALETALERAADILVHTDADNQYNQAQIPQLIQPLLDREADVVVGDRQVRSLDHMPIVKKYGNHIGSYVISKLARVQNIDASSGFRAMTRDAALRLTSFNGHTYTHQTLIEAAYKKLHITSIPIDFRQRVVGSSRLIRGVLSHVGVSLFIIVRTLLIHKPLKTFVSLGGVVLLFGVLLGARFLYFYFFVSGSGKIQSLILVAILLVVGVLLCIVGFLGDVIAHNRRLLDELLYVQKKQFFAKRDFKK